ncbi:PREDICTED: cysteine-rich protein 2, partial [Eurypyga helias]|uniref:cysteine-rich protein 2 n=1 Tax=Eurypyga helias TaxID=54383 RepID=UPI000528B8CA
EKVSSLGKDWHKFCLKCERCNKTLTPGGHAEHDGKPFCHKPCYATLFGPKGVNIASSVTTFTGEPNMCPRCGKRVYFVRCERCSKTLTPGGHAEHDGQPYCHKPCYGILFGPKGVNTGAVGSYIYDKDPEAKNQP